MFNYRRYEDRNYILNYLNATFIECDCLRVNIILLVYFVILLAQSKCTTQKFTFFYENPNIHYLAQKSLPFVSFLSQTNPFHIIPNCLTILRLRLGLCSGLLSVFPPNTYTHIVPLEVKSWIIDKIISIMISK
jgi:hypothetical protein